MLQHPAFQANPLGGMKEFALPNRFAAISEHIKNTVALAKKKAEEEKVDKIRTERQIQKIQKKVEKQKKIEEMVAILYVKNVICRENNHKMQRN